MTADEKGLLLGGPMDGRIIDVPWNCVSYIAVENEWNDPDCRYELEDGWPSSGDATYRYRGKPYNSMEKLKEMGLI